RHTRFSRDWSSDVCSSDLVLPEPDKPVKIAKGFVAKHATKVRTNAGSKRKWLSCSASRNEFITAWRFGSGGGTVSRVVLEPPSPRFTAFASSPQTPVNWSLSVSLKYVLTAPRT